MLNNGGVDALRRALARGAFGGQNKSISEAWLHMHDQKQKEQQAADERSLLERSVSAAERSARSAQLSARWALAAAVIALVVAVITVADFALNCGQ
jgi:aryl-alcohol dehydrogenase-like predicted oxidoreductase